MKKRLLCLILTILLTLSFAFQTDVQAADQPEEEFKGYLVRLGDSPRWMSHAALSTEINYEMVSDGLYLTDDLETAQALVDSGAAEFYEPNYILTLQEGTYIPSQWNLLAVKAQAAWEHADSEGLYDMLGDGVTVVVIDSGVYREHPDFNKKNILENYDLADDDTTDDGWEGWHGTFVAGIIASQVNNDLGPGYIYPDTDGVTPNVTIMPISVINGSNTTTAIVIKAIDHAVDQNADVINLSIGGTNYSTLLEKACQRAVDAGIIVVASAGNYLSDESRSSSKYMYPASCDCVISVSACRQDGDVTSGSAVNAVFDEDYSYFNDQVTVAAPGTDIMSLYIDDGVRTANGTSFSAPMVSAMAAMAKQRNKAVSPAVFETLLRESTDDLGDLGYDFYYGSGFVNIEKLANILDRSYTITYNNIENASFEEGIAMPERYTLASPDIILPEPVREGDKFMGWYEEDDSSGAPVTEIPSGSIGDRIYYAAWETDLLVTGTAEIIVNNGTYSDPDCVDPGDTLNLSLSLDKEDQSGGTAAWYDGETLLGSEYTYTVEIGDVGRIIYAVYTAPEGWLGTLATDTVTVEKAVLGGILLIEQTTGIKNGDILSLTEGSRVNGASVQSDSTNYGLQWLRNGLPIYGETNMTYMVKKGDRGQKISLTAQAKGEFYKGSLDSNEVEAEIGIPSVTLTAAPGDKKAVLSWQVMDNGGSAVTKFSVYLNDVIHKTLPASSASYTFTGLENGVSYKFRLEAYNTALDGSDQHGFSEASATPAAPAGGETGPGGGGGGGGGGFGGGGAMVPMALLYTIEAAAVSGGSITPAYSEVEEGGSITFTITPHEGFEIRDVLVNGKSVGAVSSYTFMDVSENSTIEAVFAQKTAPVADFTDVNDDDWYSEAVDFVTGLSLFKGTSENTFSPYMSMTRGMFVTVLGRLYEYMNDISLAQPQELSFADVAPDTYYVASVKWAGDNNIISGYEGGQFKPDEPISREQIVAIMYRFALYAGLDTAKTSDITAFPDSEETSSWAVEALKWATGSEILGGRTDGTLDPQGLVQRCEVAAILQRFFVNSIK